MAAQSIRVAVVGASGYTGAELLRYLLAHPRARIETLCARRAAGRTIDDVFPQFAGVLELPVTELTADATRDVDVVFTALPHRHSAEAVASLRAAGAVVIDLSADFRLDDADTYARWYLGDGDSHPAAELLASATYGLPERHRDAIRDSQLIACPGCYPTSAILAAAPLLDAGLIEPRGLIVDSKSGATGAGRGPSLATHLPEVGEGVRAYKIAGTHRHTPEIEQQLSKAAGQPVSVTFTPHLVPMSRGILTVVYGRPTDAARDPGAYLAALNTAYESEPFVTVLADALPDTAHVRGSNRAHVTARYDRRTDTVVAVSAIDNLGKGAAGQAVQCMNLLFGLAETTGLDSPPMFP